MKKRVFAVVMGAVMAMVGGTYFAEAEAKPTAEVSVASAVAELLPEVPEFTPAATAQSTWQWQGCWGWFASGCPYSIYRNSATGNYTRCTGCTAGPGHANPQNCPAISSQSLNTGRWCS